MKSSTWFFLETIGREECLQRRFKPGHQGFEYQAKYFEIYSLELKNEIFRTFLLSVSNLVGLLDELKEEKSVK